MNMSTPMVESLHSLVSGQSLSSVQRSQLATQMLSDPDWAVAFGVTPETVEDVIDVRSQLLPNLYPKVQQYWQDCQIQTPCIDLLWQFWLPLAQRLIQTHQQLNRPLIQGILGMQGAGKSTLTAMLCLILQQLGYTSLTLSIDDLYKTYADRQQLQQQDPRLIWRGPPGTHDIDIGIEILDRLRFAQAVDIPRFDKSAHNGQGDRSGFESAQPADIVLFEGWFTGLFPLPDSAFEDPPAPINTPEDLTFAQEMNQALNDYSPLWERLDSLIVLQLADYQLSKRWRINAERVAIATGKTGMDKTEVEQFVDYFWKALHPKLFIPALIQKPQAVDLVIEINAEHLPRKIYSGITT
ncbi:Uridine kinase [Acaryochloris thomasi RCC1774]|uniref:Uridine kinase n=1 Tax=Acaryochloris thomasi RCC1774 TaxID=1764569 RepID=A0A2W1JXD6_9CYAN|nr:glycerate kinase [Acaryochloris thomasi]PZD72997.1 Uridine kinase [Acaryochloris thomasi RCC1774]